MKSELFHESDLYSNTLTESKQIHRPLKLTKALTSTKRGVSDTIIPDSPMSRIKNSIKSYRYNIPASIEWSSSIYSFNRHNLILAPQISQWTYKLSKSYLNASPKKTSMDNIFVLKETSKNKEISKKKFFKIIFSIKNYLSKKGNLNPINSNSSSTGSELKKNTYIKPNKYLSLFMLKFKITPNLKRHIVKFFNTNKSTSYSSTIKDTLSQMNDTEKRYSVLKTFLSLPKIKYSSNNINILFHIYNKNNMYLLKKLQRHFNIIKKNMKKNLSLTTNILTNKLNKLPFNKSKRHLKNKYINKFHVKTRKTLENMLRNKLIYKLNHKSSISFLRYMWRHLNVKSLLYMTKDTFIFNKLVNFKPLFSKHSNMKNISQNVLNIFLSSSYLFFSKQKKGLKKVLNKFFLTFKPSEKSVNLLPNNNSFLKNLFITSHMNTIKKEMYGLKPFTNLYYFKHNTMLYYFENYKRNNNNIIPLKTVFLKIFLKKVYYNIVNLKYWNLDSKILADLITTKLIDRTKKVLKVLKKSLVHKPKYYGLPQLFKWGFTWLKEFYFTKKRFFSASRYIPSTVQNQKISHNHTIFISNKYKNHLLLGNLQHKWKSGTTVQAKGRITKRKTAQRSLLKIRRMGTLKNLLSSREGQSTSLSRGFAKSNLQYMNNNNYNENGSFGLKVYMSNLQTTQKWNIYPS